MAIGLTMHYQGENTMRAAELTEAMDRAGAVAKPLRQRHVVAWVLVVVLVLVIALVAKALRDVPTYTALPDGQE